MNEHDKSVADRIAQDHKAAHSEVTRLVPRNAGGSGYIFERHVGDRISALKVFRPDQISQQVLRDGFEFEAEQLCRLEHPNVVRAYSLGVETFPSLDVDLPYYEMEYLPFDSLDKIINEDRLSRQPRIIYALFRQCLEALRYIHSLKPDALVHLDVKEANLLVDLTSSEEPIIKLSDFGLCKVVSRDDRSTEVRGTWTYWPKEWQKRLQGLIPSNANRVPIRLPRKDVPPSVDLHMLSVTFQRVLDRLFVGHDEDYWHRALTIVLERMNWDSESLRASLAHKYETAAEVLDDVTRLERTPALPYPLQEEGSVRVPISALRSYGPATKSIVDNPWFQRLRRVRQLGLAHLVYPGAVHSRFEHSLGAYAHSLMYLSSLFENRNSPWFSISFSSNDTKALAFSALVHDLGHYPFAHQLEEIGDWPSHESLSAAILDGSVIEKYPSLTEAFGDPRQLLVAAEEQWGLDRHHVLKMFRYCFRGDLAPQQSFADVPRSWRAAAQIVNGPIDADKLDYLRRDSHHTGVPYGALNDPGRFLSALTVAFDREGTHLAVSEKGRIDAEFIPVIRYAMFSEVYWHHTVRAFTAMLRDALQRAKSWPTSPLTIENLLRWSDDRVLRELNERATQHSDLDTVEATRLLSTRKPYGRLYTLVRDDHPTLYIAMTLRRREFLDGSRFTEDAAMVERIFGIKLSSPYQLLWDIPKPGKDYLADVRIADLHGEILAKKPGPLWTSLSDGFEQWVRKIRLFIHPALAPSAVPRAEQQKRRDAVGDAIGVSLGI